MRNVSRREFLRISSIAAASTVVAACTQEVPTTAPVGDTAVATPVPESVPEATPVAEQGAGFTESPIWAEMVANGELPPIEERLPRNPHICPVMEEIGKYGGTMRRSFSGMSDQVGPSKLQETSLTWFNPDLSLRACLTDSWEQNEDARVWTFHLREGTRWSDGEYLTSEAFSWFWQNQLQNEELTLAPPTNWSTGTPSTLGTIETPDDYTVVFTFADPNPLFASKVTRAQPFCPGHYMSQFHADFADAAALDEAVKAAGVSTWVALYQDKDTWYLNPERPSLGPWLAKNTLANELFIMERNPYFYQVDAEGQQLPYIDAINHRLHESPEVFNMWVLNGEIDFFGRHLGVNNYSLFKENEEQGGYRVVLAADSRHRVIHPNQTCKDQRIRELFNERKVRLAISHAINREEINELVYDGMATPRQYSPLRQSPQSYPKQANAELEYDPDLANQLLDEAGYTERNAEGFRLWNDGSGEAIFFTIQGREPSGDPDEDASQMVIRYLAAVGINCGYKYTERSLFNQHTEVNDVEMHIGPAVRTTLPIVAPTEFLGWSIDRPWAVAWSLWKRSNGTDPNGEEPPEGHWIWDIWSLGDQMAMEPNEAERTAIFHRVLDIWAEQLPNIGILGQYPAMVIVKDGFRNYVGDYPMDDTTGDEQLLCVQTCFWDEPEKYA